MTEKHLIQMVMLDLRSSPQSQLRGSCGGSLSQIGASGGLQSSGLADALPLDDSGESSPSHWHVSRNLVFGADAIVVALIQPLTATQAPSTTLELRLPAASHSPVPGKDTRSEPAYLRYVPIKQAGTIWAA